jgi:hypothetical protein
MATTKNTDTAADEIPRGFNLVAAHLVNIKVVLESISDQMEERNNLLRGAGEAGIESAFDKAAREETTFGSETLSRIAALEAAMGTIPGKMDDLTVLVKSIAAMVHAPVAAAPVNGEAKAIANRIIEHTVAQVQGGMGSSLGAEPAPAKRGRGRPADPKKCAHPADKIETLESGLRRCTRCGAVLEAAGVAVVEKVAAVVTAAVQAGEEKLAQQIAEKAAERIEPSAAAVVKAVIEEAKKPAPVESVFKNIDGKMVEVDPETLEPIAKVEPAPEPKVEAPPVPATLDDVRAVAIGYAGKHGKEKLGAVLVKYGAGNLSSVPAEKYDALMVELQAS